MSGESKRVGVISDTHGLLRPEAVAALAGVDLILHAGDVGDAQILQTLRSVAPVTAIRGNVDRVGACSLLAAREYVTVAGMNLYMVHDLNDLDVKPEAAGIAAVIYGHSHKPSIDWRRGVLFFNPGAAGPRRFSLPVSLGVLEISEGAMVPGLIRLS